MSVLDFVEELSPADIEALIEGITFGRVSLEREERLRERIEDAPPTLREDAVAVTSVFGDLEDALGLTRSMPPSDGDPAEEAIRERTAAEREARERVTDLIDANIADAEPLQGIAEALAQQDATASELLTQERIDALTTADREQLAARAREALQQVDFDQANFPVIDEQTRRGSGRDIAYFQRVLQELRGQRDPQTLPADELDQLGDVPDVREQFIDRVQDTIDALEQDTGGRDIEMEDVLGGVEREPVRRGLTDFQQRFISLARDVGWCDVLPCRQPDRYFELSVAQQQRQYQLHPAGFLQFWVEEGLVSRTDLRERGFDPDDIP